MKKRNRLLQRVFCALLSVSLLLPYAPVYAAGEEEVNAEAGELIASPEEEGSLTNETRPEASESWYEDYAHEFRYNALRDRYELHILAYKPREKDKIPEKIVIPARTLYTEEGEKHEYVTVISFDYTKLEYYDIAGDYEASKRGLWNAGRTVITDISFEEGCILGANCERLFSYMSALHKVDLSKVDASEITNMRAMFYYAPSLETVVFGEHFDSSKNTSLYCTFADCHHLKYLDLSGVDSSSVTNMWSMFSSDHDLEELTLGGKFTTAKSEDLSNLFSGCDSLASIPMDNIDTSSATLMGAMFSSCESLVEADISGFKMDKADSLAAMFSGCKSLKRVKFGNVNTSTIKSIEGMFENCYSLRSLDLRSFDFSGLNGAENECRYDNFLCGSGVVNLYLPVAAPAGVDLTQEGTYGPPSVHMATTAENLATVYYAGSEEEWTALGNTLPESVKIEYAYAGEEKEVSGTFYVSEIILNENWLELEAGKTAQLTASVFPSDATDKGISWSVKDTKIASVDANGLVTAKSQGSTEIIATAKGAAKGNTVTAKCQIYVSGNGGGREDPKPVDPPTPVPGSDEATDPQPEITAEAAQALTLVVGQKFNVGKGWTSNSKSLSVNKNTGAVKAKKEGTATLKHEDGAHTISVTIVKPSVKKSTTLDAGKTEQLTVDNAEGLAVLWTSGAPDVATVNDEGLVTAVAKGSAKITAWVNGSAYKCSVKVTESTPVKEGRTLHLNVNGGSKSVSIKGLSKPEWKLDEGSEEGIVEIIKGKKIKGIAAGTVTLVSGNGEYKVDVTVEDPTIVGSAAKTPYKLALDMTVGGTKEIRLTNVSQDVVFKSNKSNVAFISAEPDADGNYTITARGKGTAKITAKVNGKSLTIIVKVK